MAGMVPSELFLTNELSASGIIVNKSCDEELLEFFEINSSQKICRIAWVPSLECNEGCRYCFQKSVRSTGFSDYKVVSASMLFINEFIRFYNLSELHLDILGGELLNYLPETINFLECINAQSIVPITSRLTTAAINRLNLVNAKLLSYLESFRVTIHPHKFSTSNLDQILSFFELFSSYVKFRYIRVNIRDNADIKKYISIISKFGAWPKGITTQIGIIVPTNEKQKDGRKSISRESIIELLEALIPYCERVSFCKDISSCTIKSQAAFAIDPDGYIYKCLNVVGQKKVSIGTIWDKSVIRLIRLKTAATPDPCHNCVWLPECNGGCPYVSFALEKNWNKFDCPLSNIENYGDHIFMAVKNSGRF